MRSTGSGWGCTGILSACIVAFAPACSGNAGVEIPNVEAGVDASAPDGTLSDSGQDSPDSAGSDSSQLADSPDDSSADAARDATADATVDAMTDAAPPPCAPLGSTETRACGMCGTQLRVCSSSLTWSDWSSCSGETGLCLPGATDTTSEGCDSGSKTRTCQAACTWDAFGPCL